jgi:hypothetical protein
MKHIADLGHALSSQARHNKCGTGANIRSDNACPTQMLDSMHYCMMSLDRDIGT